MNRWIRHAIAWFMLVIGGVVGYVMFEYMNHHVVKGLGFATATILIDLGILFIHEDIKRWREERN